MKVLSVDPGRKNLALCVLETRDAQPNGTEDTILFWLLVETPTQASGLRHALDTALGSVEYDQVVIERQPPRNPGMKRFEHLFEMYFTMQEKPVHIIDARKKLVFASSTPFCKDVVIKERGKMTLSYSRRKCLSVATVSEFLKHTESRHRFYKLQFDQAKKKDDYADALLQAQAYAHIKMRGKSDFGQVKARTAPEDQHTSHAILPNHRGEIEEGDRPSV